MTLLMEEVVDSQSMTETTKEITKVDVSLFLGITMASEVFGQYIKYSTGSHIVIIHKQEHYLDKEASLVTLDYSMNVSPKPGYGEKAQSFLSTLSRQFHFLVRAVQLPQA